MKISLHILFHFLLQIIIAVNTFAYTPNKVYKITILHTNDHHGRFWSNNKGEYGLAARSTLIKSIREEVKNAGGISLLLDAGDVNKGNPQSDILLAEPDFKGMKELGYDAMALGNHEFDNTLDVIKQQQIWAGFPFLSANTYNKITKKRIFPSHIVKKHDDLKITIMGLTTEDTAMKSTNGGKGNLYFKPAVDEAKTLVPKLKKKTDILIAVTHMGHYVNEQHGVNAPGDVTLARNAPGIDLIIGGHTQKALFEPDLQNGTIIVQAEEWGKYLGRVDLEFLNGKLTLKDYKLIPVNYKMTTENRIPEDPAILELLRPFKELGDQTLLTKIGYAEEAFLGDRSVIRNQETNLGNLVSYVYKTALKTDIGLVNGGGIRATLPVGEINHASILTIFPFGSDEVGKVTLTGNELKKYLTQILLNFGPGAEAETGGFPHISGVTATINRNLNTVEDIKINGVAIDNDRTYTIATSRFLAEGGDKYPITIKNYLSLGLRDADLVIKYIQEQKILRTNEFKVNNYIQVSR